MTAENKAILQKRTKSFAWRLSGMVAVAVLAFLSENILLLGWPVWIVGILSLVAGEVTKYLNVDMRK